MPLSILLNITSRLIITVHESKCNLEQCYWVHQPVAQLKQMHLDHPRPVRPVLYNLSSSKVAISCETDEDYDDSVIMMTTMMNHNLSSHRSSFCHHYPSIHHSMFFKDDLWPWWMLQPTHQVLTSHYKMSCKDCKEVFSSCKAFSASFSNLGSSWCLGTKHRKTINRKTGAQTTMTPSCCREKPS